MKKNYTLLILLLVGVECFSINDSLVNFSTAIRENIRSFKKSTTTILYKNEIENIENAFNSFINNKIVGTQFDNFSFKRVNKSRVEIHTIKKPIVLITYKSWSLIEKGEIPAINKLAKENKNNLQFIIVFWDKKQEMRKIAKQFDSNVMVCYAHKKCNKDLKSIKYLKNVFGNTAIYQIDADKRIVTIRKKHADKDYGVSKEKSIVSNYSKLNKSINEMILSTVKKSTLVKN